MHVFLLTFHPSRMSKYLKAKVKSHLGSARFRFFMNARGDEAHGNIALVI